MTPTATSTNDTFSRLEVEAAICAYEYIDSVLSPRDGTNPKSEHESLVEACDGNSIATRHACMEVGRLAAAVHASKPASYWDNVNFDFEFVPYVVNELEWTPHVSGLFWTPSDMDDFAERILARHANNPAPLIGPSPTRPEAYRL